MLKIISFFQSWGKYCHLKGLVIWTWIPLQLGIRKILPAPLIGQGVRAESPLPEQLVWAERAYNLSCSSLPFGQEIVGKLNPGDLGIGELVYLIMLETTNHL